MSVQHRKHEMDEADISCLRLNLETRDEVPARMTVVTFATFSDLNCGFHLQTSRLAAFLCRRIDEIGIGLIGVVLVGRMVVESIAENI